MDLMTGRKNQGADAAPLANTLPNLAASTAGSRTRCNLTWRFCVVLRCL
jgi:hypothetical protein